MDPNKVLGYCDQIDVLTQQIRDEVLTPVPPNPLDPKVVHAGDDLQAALDIGGGLILEPDATFERDAGYVFAVDNTVLSGSGNNTLLSDTAPVIAVPTGFENAGLVDLGLVTERSEVVVRIGRNDDQQTTVEQSPRKMTIRSVTNVAHRGKRCFEVNARSVAILNCSVRDLYQPEKQDSQAIWIGNAPGPVLVEGGWFEAASECLMVGGDAMKIPNCRPTGITVRGAQFTKPLSFQHDGIPVKNIFELKDGHDVLVEDCELWHCWKSAQDGYAFMLTPTRGGSLRNVVIRDCHVHDVGGLVNITGRDAGGNYPHEPRSQITLSGGEYRTNTAAFPGPGRFALITNGPESFIVDYASITHQGSAFIDCADKNAIDVLHVLNSTWNYGSYGIRIGGYNHGDNQLGIIRDLRIEGNTISGAHSSFKSRYPNNTYIATMTAAQEREVDRPERVRVVQRDLEEELDRLFASLREDRR